ncbi:hypothetical protein GCM10017673_11470 [Streptosporangium violaceochromogenes]|nr:hypothetical protein GCM10017673_11470 [Streptosporangium violaceochromogenes]
MNDTPSAGRQPAGFRSDVPHSARIWNYWLGGKDNYPADRDAGDMVERMIPGIADAARANRAFLCRAVRHMVTEGGVRQFLDIGTGLPTADNTHEVAQRIAPECRIVYVDNDPLVLAHARALLTSSSAGACHYIDADVRDLDHILKVAGTILDLSRPVGLMLLGILNHVLDDGQARGIVNRLMDALPSGSYLAIGHPTAEVHGEAMHESMREFMRQGGTPITARSRGELELFFEGLELVEPGVVSCSRWRPEFTPFGAPAEVSEFCGVARKP